MTGSFYQSAAPEVIAVWDSWQTQYRRYIEQIKVLETEYPNCSVWESSFLGSKHVCGLEWHQKPGRGWVRADNGQYWLPNWKSEIGKQVGQRLREIRCPHMSLPGMPAEVHVPGHLYSHSLERFGVSIWVRWTPDADKVEATTGFDTALWTRAKASEYHLAKEAHEAAKGGAA